MHRTVTSIPANQYELKEATDEFEALLSDWTRPDGPIKVALQVGHWKVNEVPDELENLRTHTGSSGGGKAEWEINYQIAILTKAALEKHDILVDILPATVPQRYWADVFVAIHADGNTDNTVNGFKVAAPRRDMTGKARALAQTIQAAYEQSTKLSIDPTITRNMTGYYAFSWHRYLHAVHPMTVSAILETGFLTSALDRKVILSKPQVAAQGLSNGIVDYLTQSGLLSKKEEPAES